MLYYIIQIIIFQLLFLIIYDAFLKRETFFNWNRCYLLITPVLSTLIPLIKIPQFREIVPQDYMIHLPEILIGATKTDAVSKTRLDAVVLETVNFMSWKILFMLGTTLITVLFFFKVFRIIKLIITSPKQRQGNYTIIQLPDSASAFSFFNYVFLGDNIPAKEKETILQHEIIHIKQKHSLDLLFFEGLKIVFWYNPLVYAYQRRIQAIHEYIADAKALQYQGKSQYYKNLLSQVFETKNVSFINPFFKQSLIKKRIIMLQKSKSKQKSLWKYGILLPVILIMLIYSSCSKEETKEIVNQDKIEDSQIKESIKDGVITLQISNFKELSTADKTKILEDYINRKIPGTDTYYKIIVKSDNTRIIFGGDITKVNANKENQISDEIEVPFGFIERVPTFPECDSELNEERKKCTSETISRFVSRSFNTELAKDLNLKGRQRIHVIFKISKEGDIIDVKARAPHPELEKEAIRVINALPKMIPGEQKGKKVNVPYALPIVFQVVD
ncbi:M56 family metallopeptidase [Hyunsoonleella pacifica]|uniref:BlaR1 peptidase M56 family protein n=1 Tax=Hyunsoonleella pacifica TaxID=1080224 RepID=A0A4Q9FN21_9FLAO|nr:M56 family metallopeptidase [Hyunsoonleella pacifica]TBN15647.1 blaR1 peptidase M56 family protein [Hyunsoonleella pacifica]GGD21528.1 hypothetical protein GCM10011368_24380 [Hyunsoonleella pacifica]